MGRSTNTRARVREVAQQLQAQGIEPTPTLVRNILGSGSPNTIVEELKAFKAAGIRVSSPATGLPSPEGEAPAAAPALPQRGGELAELALKEVFKTLDELRTLTAEQRLMAQTAVARDQVIDSLATRLSTSLEVVVQTQETLAEEYRKVSETLGKMQERMDGVQRHMLMSIEQARAETAHWKERATAYKAEISTWRLTYQQRYDAHNNEMRELRAQLDRSRD